MFVQLLDALKTEGMTAWKGDWFLVIVVVCFKANATLEY
jgi:hypothetical protein